MVRDNFVLQSSYFWFLWRWLRWWFWIWKYFCFDFFFFNWFCIWHIFFFYFLFIFFLLFQFLLKAISMRRLLLRGCKLKTKSTLGIIFWGLSLSDLSDEFTEFWFVFSFDLYLSFFFPFDVPFSVFPLVSVIFCFCFLILIGIPNKELKSFCTGRFRDIFALKPISKGINTVTRVSKRWIIIYLFQAFIG